MPKGIQSNPLLSGGCCWARYKVLAEIFELSTYFAALGNKKT